MTSRSSACESLDRRLRRRRAILDNVTFDVRRGEVFVILGGSGSGKSTLLKHMIGLLPAARRHVAIDGATSSTADGDARRAILRKFGVMYQSGALFGSMTLLGERAGCRWRSTRTSRPTQIEPDRADEARRSSGSRCSPATCRLRSPAACRSARRSRARWRSIRMILFLDEPSAGLDPITSAELDALIKRLARQPRRDVRRRHARASRASTRSPIASIMLDRRK